MGRSVICGVEEGTDGPELQSMDFIKVNPVESSTRQSLTNLHTP